MRHLVEFLLDLALPIAWLAVFVLVALNIAAHVRIDARLNDPPSVPCHD